MKVNARRLLLVMAALAALSMLSLAAWVPFTPSIAKRFERIRFDPVAWQSARHTAVDVRIHMVDDLLHHHELKGMTREQLTAIVGQPDQTEYFQDYDLVYWLGPERGFMSIDSEWLVFRFDNDDRVMDYKIVRD